MHIAPEQSPGDRSATVWERIEAQSDVDEVLQSRAAFELKRRLQHWNGDYLPRPSRFKNKTAVDRSTHLVLPADPVELVIVRAVAMTQGAAQFGVSPDGSIFTAEGNGWTIGGPRVDVTRLSWLLDEAADILQHIKRGRGGRFYERGGRFFLADRKTTILEVVEETDPATVGTPNATGGAPRSWWQRAVNTVSRRLQDRLPPETATRLPDEVRARQAPVQRRVRTPSSSGGSTTGPRPSRARRGAARAEKICPIHFAVLATNGRCEDCAID